MALYSLREKIYFHNGELYIRQAMPQDDAESLGRRLQESCTQSQSAKLYPSAKKSNSPRKHPVIVSHSAPFKSLDKKQIEEITARLSGSSTFAAKMRKNGPEPSQETCDRKIHQPVQVEKETKEPPPSRQATKSVHKKPPQTQVEKTKQANVSSSPANKTSINQTGNSGAKERSSNDKNVRFNGTGNKSSQSNGKRKTKSDSSPEKPGRLLRMLLDE